MRALSVFIISSLIIGTALAEDYAPSARAANTGLDNIQGTWVGNEVGREGQVSMVFSGKWVSFKGIFPQEWYKGSGVFADNRTPKHADFLIEDCAAPDFIGKIAKCIYKLDDDDILTLAGAAPGINERPSNFHPADGIRIFRLTLQPSSQEDGFALIETTNPFSQ